MLLTGTSNEGFADKLRALTDGRRVDAVFDPIGGGLMQHYVGALAKNARIRAPRRTHGKVVIETGVK